MNTTLTGREEKTILRTEMRNKMVDKCIIEVKIRKDASGFEELSICGSVFEKRRNGRWTDIGGGQCQDSLRRSDYSPNKFQSTLLDVWDRWHLNGMKACCEHIEDGRMTEKLEVVHYGLTHEAMELRTKAMERMARDAAAKRSIPSTPTERALVLLEDWFKDRFTPPDADSPLSGCYEVKKRETRYALQVTEAENPKGLLSKPCHTCGYKQGNKWLKEELPKELVLWLSTSGKEGSPCLDTPPSRLRDAKGVLQ